jgi:uncharacterized membrane-anchored protein YhcB (DUF1043 family)
MNTKYIILIVVGIIVLYLIWRFFPRQQSTTSNTTSSPGVGDFYPDSSTTYA